MGLFYENLDDRTRQLMLDEMEYDLAHNQLHISPFLSGQGQHDYANLLREAIQNGTDESLAEHLRAHRRILRTLPRRLPKSGGYSIAATPENAAEVLAESEFNRYYIRALARRAIEDGIQELVVYRAKPARNPRPESEARVETALSPQELLDDLRSHPGDEAPKLGVPSGPNSGLSVRLP
jgi:DNA repair photolyase